MAKLTLNDIASLSNQPAAVQTINDNFTAIEEAIENTVSRDGTLPNQMEADLDLNSNKLLNVAEGVALTDGVNLGQVMDLVGTGGGGGGGVVDAAAIAAALGYTPANQARQITAGDGLTGGGDLSADITINVGTPSTVTSTSTNSTTAGSHTHALVIDDASLTIAKTAGLQTALNSKVESSSLASATGETLVGYQQTGTGTVARTLNKLIDDGPLYAKDFGVIADGVANDTTALQAAVNSAISQQRQLILPAGTILVSATISAVGNLRMKGAGSGSFAYGGLPAVSNTTIKGTHTTPLFRIENSLAGTEVVGITFEANNTCSICLDLKSVNRGVFTDLYFKEPRVYGLRLWCNSNVNTMYNTFTNMFALATNTNSIGIYLTGAADPALANTCHNVFTNTKVDYTGTNGEGIRIGNSDNNLFFETYIFSPNGTEAQGITLVNEYSAFPISTGFYHLQAGPKGMVVQDGLNDNYVYGYAKDNGQPDPTYSPTLSRFFWTSAEGRISNVRSLNEVSVESGSKIRLNGYLTGNTWLAGNASSIDFSVNGTVTVSFGDTVNSFVRPTQFNTNVGFYGTAPVAKPTVTGSRGGNAALASLLTALATMGLITNSTSA